MPLPTVSFAAVAETIKPSVININTVSRGAGLQGRTPFEEFFGEEFYRRFFGELPERIPLRSLGSGVIVDPKGIALTNAHVVERATDIEVITLDGNKHKAKIVGLEFPSRMARTIYTELLDKGRVTRGWLGVQIQQLTPELAREFGVKDAQGVLVSDIVPDSPAAKAGIQRGDVLTEFDGKRLEG